jgi:hypothetical protein
MLCFYACILCLHACILCCHACILCFHACILCFYACMLFSMYAWFSSMHVCYASLSSLLPFMHAWLSIYACFQHTNTSSLLHACLIMYKHRCLHLCHSKSSYCKSKPDADVHACNS